ARADRIRGWPGLVGSNDLAFGIVGIALLAPAHREAVALAPVHHERDCLGRLSERERQATRGERIERARVARTLGREQALDYCDRMGRGHADRFVEDHPAVHVALFALVLLPRTPALILRRARSARLEGGRRADASRRFLRRLLSMRNSEVVQALVDHASSPPSFHSRSRRTSGVRNIFSIRSASSNRSSNRKRMSGANFRLTRRAISPRRNFLLLSSASITCFASRPPSGFT